MKPLLLPMALLLLPLPSWAAQRTVTLAVPGMNCAICPITVKKALTRLPGVLDVSSNLEKRQTTVVFDDAKTTLAAITQATRDVGFPSSVAAEPARP